VRYFGIVIILLISPQFFTNFFANLVLTRLAASWCPIRYLSQLYASSSGGEPAAAAAAAAAAAPRFTEESMPTIKVNVPQQPNNCDCGVFMLQYAEVFLAKVRLVVHCDVFFFFFFIFLTSNFIG
jgi:hypothetical protein